MPKRNPDGQSMSDIKSCESPDQISYWGGILVNGPVWPDSPEQSQKTTSAKAIHYIHKKLLKFLNISKIIINFRTALKSVLITA